MRRPPTNPVLDSIGLPGRPTPMNMDLDIDSPIQQPSPYRSQPVGQPQQFEIGSPATSSSQQVPSSHKATSDSRYNNNGNNFTSVAPVQNQSPTQIPTLREGKRKSAVVDAAKKVGNFMSAAVRGVLMLQIPDTTTISQQQSPHSSATSPGHNRGLADPFARPQGGNISSSNSLQSRASISSMASGASFKGASFRQHREALTKEGQLATSPSGSGHPLQTSNSQGDSFFRNQNTSLNISVSSLPNSIANSVSSSMVPNSAASMLNPPKSATQVFGSTTSVNPMASYSQHSLRAQREELRASGTLLMTGEFDMDSKAEDNKKLKSQTSPILADGSNLKGSRSLEHMVRGKARGSTLGNFRNSKETAPRIQQTLSLDDEEDELSPDKKSSSLRSNVSSVDPKATFSMFSLRSQRSALKGSGTLMSVDLKTSEETSAVVQHNLKSKTASALMASHSSSGSCNAEPSSPLLTKKDLKQSTVGTLLSIPGSVSSGVPRQAVPKAKPGVLPSSSSFNVGSQLSKSATSDIKRFVSNPVEKKSYMSSMSTYSLRDQRTALKNAGGLLTNNADTGVRAGLDLDDATPVVCPPKTYDTGNSKIRNFPKPAEDDLTKQGSLKSLGSTLNTPTMYDYPRISSRSIGEDIGNPMASVAGVSLRHQRANLKCGGSLYGPSLDLDMKEDVTNRPRFSVGQGPPSPIGQEEPLKASHTMDSTIHVSHTMSVQDQTENEQTKWTFSQFAPWSVFFPLAGVLFSLALTISASYAQGVEQAIPTGAQSIHEHVDFEMSRRVFNSRPIEPSCWGAHTGDNYCAPNYLYFTILLFLIIWALVCMRLVVIGYDRLVIKSTSDRNRHKPLGMQAIGFSGTVATMMDRGSIAWSEAGAPVDYEPGPQSVAELQLIQGKHYERPESNCLAWSPWHCFHIGGNHFWARAVLLVFLSVATQILQGFIIKEGYAFSSAAALTSLWVVVSFEVIFFMWALYHRAEPILFASTATCNAIYLIIRFGTHGFLSLQCESFIDFICLLVPAVILLICCWEVLCLLAGTRVLAQAPLYTDWPRRLTRYRASAGFVFVVLCIVLGTLVSWSIEDCDDYFAQHLPEGVFCVANFNLYLSPSCECKHITFDVKSSPICAGMGSFHNQLKPHLERFENAEKLTVTGLAHANSRCDFGHLDKVMIGDMTNLRSIYFDEYPLSEIPSDWKSLTKVRQFDIDYGFIKSFENANHWTRLEHISCGMCLQLHSIPEQDDFPRLDGVQVSGDAPVCSDEKFNSFLSCPHYFPVDSNCEPFPAWLVSHIRDRLSNAEQSNSCLRPHCVSMLQRFVSYDENANGYWELQEVSRYIAKISVDSGNAVLGLTLASQPVENFNCLFREAFGVGFGTERLTLANVTKWLSGQSTCSSCDEYQALATSYN